MSDYLHKEMSFNLFPAGFSVRTNPLFVSLFSKADIDVQKEKKLIQNVFVSVHLCFQP